MFISLHCEIEDVGLIRPFSLFVRYRHNNINNIHVLYNTATLCVRLCLTTMAVGVVLKAGWALKAHLVLVTVFILGIYRVEYSPKSLICPQKS